MNESKLYRGVWPQNVSKLAKYALRLVDRDWKVTVQYEVEQGLTFLAVEDRDTELVTRINALRRAVGSQPGGPFYINEYHHVIVPVKAKDGIGTGSVYYYAGIHDEEFTFEFEGSALTTRPVARSGAPLQPGDRWIGPRPGIPYVLAAGGEDIYYETPALTDGDPAEVRPNMTRKVQLSRVLGDKAAVGRATQPIAAVRGYMGGRFYVNEHSAIFTPVGAGDGNGLDYIYCGQLDRGVWFPEPSSQ